MAIGRPKSFSRAGVLEKAIPVFWDHGFADTSLADLEAATGVNRSGLYTEFKDKEDLFLASLAHYLETSDLTDRLADTPLGWDNVERYLKIGLACWTGQRGCFSISAMRELAILPGEARVLVEKSMKPIKRLLTKNIEAEHTRMNAAAIADIAMTFFAGISIEQNIATSQAFGLKRIDTFMNVLKQL